MTLANDIAANLPYLRSEAEARMLDSCTIGTFKEEPDPVTYETIYTLIESQYVGPCRISSKSNAVAERQAGGQSFADESLLLSVPVSTGGAIRTDARVLVTAVDAVTGNPAMVGRMFRVAGLANGSQVTAARFLLEATS